MIIPAAGPASRLAALGLAALICACQAPAPPSTATGLRGSITVAADLPLSGAEAPNGQPVLNGIQFAVLRQPVISGFKVVVQPYDVTTGGIHDPQRGADQMDRMIGDLHVLGAVGPFHSTVARAQIPGANQAHLAIISPANTNECLTKDLPQCAGLAVALRPTGVNNYFRTVTTDDLQGPAMAHFAFDTLELAKVAVISDGQVFGRSQADSFQSAYQKLGGQLAGTRLDYEPQILSDFRPFLNQARDAGAQAVFFGGVTATKGCRMRAQMRDIFPPGTPMLGDYGIAQDPQCIKDAGDAAPGIYAAVSVRDPEQVVIARSAVEAFKKAYPNPDDYSAYAIAALDATGIMLAAIDRAIRTAGGLPSREQVRAEVAATRGYPGALGRTDFDAHGDTSLRIVTIYQSLSSDPEAPWRWSAEIPVPAGT